ncbi:MAG: RNA polymerase sigma factor RpoD, partial [Bacillota bacterium]
MDASEVKRQLLEVDEVKRLVEQAQERGGVISEGEIADALQSVDLDAEQIDDVYQL